MRKVVYLVIYPDFLELPIGLYPTLQSAADWAGVTIEQLQYAIDNHEKINNRYFEVVNLPIKKYPH